MSNHSVSEPKSKMQADYIYKSVGDREISLTFLPPKKELYAKAPVYFIISGGGWHAESRESMLDFSKLSVERLRESGYATVSIDYRVVTEPGIVMRDIVTDCFDALRFIAFYADTLCIDKNNIITSGHSAGGHLALMIAYANPDDFRCETSLDADFTVTATIPLSGISVVYGEGYPTNSLSLPDCFVGCDTLEERKALSPISYVKKTCPPTLLCAGSKDDLVPCYISEILYNELKKCGGDAKIVISYNGGHCFEPMVEGFYSYPDRDEIQDILISFVLEKTKP